MTLGGSPVGYRFPALDPSERRGYADPPDKSGPKMPVLPLVDLLILLGTLALVVGVLLKSIAILTAFQPALLGFTSLDFVVIAGVCMGFALTLVARTWLKLNENSPNVVQRRYAAELSREREERLREAADAGQQEP